MKLKKILSFSIAVALLFSICGTALAISDPSAIVFTNPLQYGTVQLALTGVLRYLQGIIVLIAIVFIVVGGILYITSAGDEKRMTTAKGAITAAMIGLAIGVAAPSFLKEIYTIVGGTDCAGLTGTALTDCEAVLSGGRTITQIAMSALNFLLSLVGVLGIIMMVVGGMMYITSAGDEDRAEIGKKMIKYSIIGIVVALTSLVAVTQITVFFDV